MHKKLITACLAIAAFAAFVVASSASAAVITHPTGTLAPVGTKIEAHNTATALFTDNNTNILTECSSATLTGEITANGSGASAGNVTSASFTGTASEGRCTSSFGNIKVTTEVEKVNWCLKAPKGTDTFEVRGGKCSEAQQAINFTLDSSLAGECKYSNANSISGELTTDVAPNFHDAEVHIFEQGPWKKSSGGFLCPAEGRLDFTFTLETDSPATEPVYFS